MKNEIIMSKHSTAEEHTAAVVAGFPGEGATDTRSGVPDSPAARGKGDLIRRGVPPC